MTALTIHRVITLPGTLQPSSLYIVRASDSDKSELYFTGNDGTEVRHILNKAEVAAMIAAAGGSGGPATSLATARTISITGDAAWSVSFDGSGNVTSALTLTNTGVVAGSYPKVTVDSKGRVTAGLALAATDIPVLDASKITTGTLTLNTTGNAATATKLATARTINGVTFDGTADITISSTDAIPRIAVSEKGVANGVATLDATGKVPASQLPSYVDDVLEFANLAAFPAVGDAGKIYTALDTNAIYRWSGSIYVSIGSGGGAADTAVKLLTARSITATGDAAFTVNFDGSANVTSPLTLSTTGVAAGTYPKVTVDTKGRVTAGSVLAVADIPTLDYLKVTSAASINLPTAEW